MKASKYVSAFAGLLLGACSSYQPAPPHYVTRYEVPAAQPRLIYVSYPSATKAESSISQPLASPLPRQEQKPALEGIVAPKEDEVCPGGNCKIPGK